MKLHVPKKGAKQIRTCLTRKTGRERRALLGKLGPGDCFAKFTLTYTATRAATMVAIKGTRVMEISRSQFRNLLAAALDQITKEYFRDIDDMEIFDSWNDQEKTLLATALLENPLTEHEIIFEQWDKNKMFCILVEGTLQDERDKLVEGIVPVEVDKKTAVDLATTSTEPRFLGKLLCGTMTLMQEHLTNQAVMLICRCKAGCAFVHNHGCQWHPSQNRRSLEFAEGRHVWGCTHEEIRGAHSRRTLIRSILGGMRYWATQVSPPCKQRHSIGTAAGPLVGRLIPVLGDPKRST